MKKSGSDLTRFELLYADEQCIGLHKDPGIPCQSKDLEGPEPLDRSLQIYLNEPVRIWTRIDQPVSGVVLFYRDRLSPINTTLKVIEKIYLAIVEGHPEQGQTIISYLNRDGRKMKAYESPDGQKAELSYDILHQFDRYTLLQVRPATGRFHQIRQQLSWIGHPVKGDVKYGARRKNPDRSIHLHALRYTIQDHHQVPVEVYDLSLPDDPLWNLTRPFIPPAKSIAIHS